MVIGKCKRRPAWDYKMGEEIVMKSKKEKDQGVGVHDTDSRDGYLSMLT